MADLKTKNGTKFLVYVLIGACLFYLTAADFSFSQADSPESCIQDGKQLLEKGDFGPSLEKLAKAEAFLKSGPGEPSPEKLAEVYFYQGLNYGSQGQASLAKDLFKKALREAPNKAYDTSAMNPETQRIFGKAKLDIEKENGPRAMGTAGAPGEGRHSSTLAWVVLGIVVVAAAAVAAYFLFFKRARATSTSIRTPRGQRSISTAPTQTRQHPVP